MIYDFTGDHKERLEALVSELEEQRSHTSRAFRIKVAGSILNDYVAQLGRTPNDALMKRITDVVLDEELSDKRPDKVTLEAYPILSDRQLGRRMTGSERHRNKSGAIVTEVPLEHAMNVGTDGIDYTLPIRTFTPWGP